MLKLKDSTKLKAEVFDVSKLGHRLLSIRLLLFFNCNSFMIYSVTRADANVSVSFGKL